MPVIELDPIDGPLRDSRNPVTIIDGITAPMAAPTNVTDGVVVGRFGLVRLYFLFGGTIAGFGGTLWLRNRATGQWFRAASLTDFKSFSQLGEYLDLALSPGDEFYVQVSTLSGTTPTLTVVAAQGSSGLPLVQGRQFLFADTELAAAVSVSDAMTLSASQAAVLAVQTQYNGATYERERTIESRNLYTSAARTASPTPTDQLNYGSRGLLVTIKATVLTGAGVTFHVEGKDSLGGDYYILLSSATLVAPTGASAPVRLLIYPTMAAVANQIASYVLPRTFRVRPAHGDTASVTYSVLAELLP